MLKRKAPSRLLQKELKSAEAEVRAEANVEEIAEVEKNSVSISFFHSNTCNGNLFSELEKKCSKSQLVMLAKSNIIHKRFNLLTAYSYMHCIS